MVSKLLIEQLKEIAGQLEWTLLNVQLDGETVMLVIGEPQCVDEYFQDEY